MEENTSRLLQQQWRWVYASCGSVVDGNDEDAALGWGTGSKGEGISGDAKALFHIVVNPGRLRQRVLIACQRMG